MTRQELFVKYLQLRGYHQEKTRSKRAIKMSNGRTTFWVGLKGGVRRGPTLSDSVSVGHINWPKVEEIVNAENL